MLLKQHEESRLLQHKAAIDQYTEQLRCYELEMVSDNISNETKTELEKLKIEVNSKLEYEITGIKNFTLELQKEYDSYTFDDFMTLVVNAINEAEKILSVLPEDLRKPFLVTAEKVKSVLNYLKSIF